MSVMPIPPDPRVVALEERMGRLEQLTLKLSRSLLRQSRMIARLAGVPASDLDAEWERMRAELKNLGITDPEL